MLAAVDPASALIGKVAAEPVHLGGKLADDLRCGEVLIVQNRGSQPAWRQARGFFDAGLMVTSLRLISPI